MTTQEIQVCSKLSMKCLTNAYLYRILFLFLVYKSHNGRAAASSKAGIRPVPISETTSAAGWSDAGTFSTFYCKNVRPKDSFSREVLKCNIKA